MITKRRVFVVGVRGKCEIVNPESVRIANGWKRLLTDLKANEDRAYAKFEKRMLRPKMPRLPS